MRGASISFPRTAFVTVLFVLVPQYSQSWAPITTIKTKRCASTIFSSVERLRWLERAGTRASPLQHRAVEPKLAEAEEQEKEGDASNNDEISDEIEEATRKWGLEGGLLKSAQQGNFDVAKQLLKKYGAAYLVTSISLALVSYALCFKLIDSGVDVTALLAKVGISADTGSAGETAGTATIAYIVHKAASPIRTVPVIAITPVVAEWMGKEPVEDDIVGGG